jgi:hypothetical protein
MSALLQRGSVCGSWGDGSGACEGRRGSMPAITAAWDLRKQRRSPPVQPSQELLVIMMLSVADGRVETAHSACQNSAAPIPP